MLTETGRGWTLHCCDCLEWMAEQGDGAVDHVITDPPYGISDAPMLNLPGRGDRGNNMWAPPSDWDHQIDHRWCSAVCTIASTVAWFGHWRMREEVTAGMAHPLRAEIVWAKDCHVGPPCPVARRDERIWLFAAHGVGGQCFDTSVWDEPIIPTWAHKYHKNQKPVRLMMRLVRFLAAPGDFICDPFAGSGTTGVACLRLGRRFVGCEINEKYFDIAVERLRAAERETTVEADRAGQLPLLEGLT